jgi:large subunit ribosomal protein L4
VLSGLVDGDAPSTKTAIGALANVSDRARLLVVIGREDLHGWKSLRNIDRVHAIVPDQLNTYDVLCSDDVVFTVDALQTFVAGPVKGAEPVIEQPVSEQPLSEQEVVQ